jgi:hypothetical protein
MRPQDDFNEKVFIPRKHRRCDFLLFRLRLSWGTRHAQHLVQFHRLSARGYSRWAPCARESRQPVDWSRSRFNGDKHGDTSLRYYNYA